jgi:hypothetical protein
MENVIKVIFGGVFGEFKKNRKFKSFIFDSQTRLSSLQVEFFCFEKRSDEDFTWDYFNGAALFPNEIRIIIEYKETIEIHFLRKK